MIPSRIDRIILIILFLIMLAAWATGSDRAGWFALAVISFCLGVVHRSRKF